MRYSVVLILLAFCVARNLSARDEEYYEEYDDSNDYDPNVDHHYSNEHHGGMEKWSANRGGEPQDRTRGYNNPVGTQVFVEDPQRSGNPSYPRENYPPYYAGRETQVDAARPTYPQGNNIPQPVAPHYNQPDVRPQPSGPYQTLDLPASRDNVRGFGEVGAGERGAYGGPEERRPQETPMYSRSDDRLDARPTGQQSSYENVHGTNEYMPSGRFETLGPYRTQELPVTIPNVGEEPHVTHEKTPEDYQPRPLDSEQHTDVRSQNLDPRYGSQSPDAPRPYDPYDDSESRRSDPYRPSEYPGQPSPSQPEYTDPNRRENEERQRYPYEDTRYPYHSQSGSEQDPSRRPYVDRRDPTRYPDPREVEYKPQEYPNVYERPSEREYEHRPQYPSEQSVSPLVVDIPSLGLVQSKLDRTASTRQVVHSFMNLRYAESPRGHRRFQAPEPVRPWQGIFDGSNENISCPSFMDLSKVAAAERYSDVEDCLRLTVYTKNVSARQPVIVYVHGEFFLEGSSAEATPEYLLEKDVILVSLDYRLAPFGFLSTLTSRIPGNVAVLDVVEGLKWVQNNIRYFGGDPGRVTVFGQGAGAALVHVLTFSPAVPPRLFNRVILSSGSALSPFFLTEDPLRHANEIARNAGCQVTDVPGSYDECLINLTPSRLLEAFMTHGQQNEYKGFGSFGGFQLVVGDRSNVLPRHPEEMLSTWTGNSYSMMTGTTRNVGSYLYKKIARLNERELLDRFDVNRAASAFVKYLVPENKQPHFERMFHNQLIVDPTYTFNLTYVAPSLIDLVGNAVYKVPVFDAADRNWRIQGAETYVYTFDFVGPKNRFNVSVPVKALKFDPGVSLSDENIYLFPFPKWVSDLMGWQQDVSRMMVDLWTSFAEQGRPLLTHNTYYWQPLSRPEGPYVKISNVMEPGENLSDELTRTAKGFFSKIRM